MDGRVITPDDVVRAGACADGVGEFVRRCEGIAAAVTAAVAQRFARTDEERSWIRRAAEIDGSGSGYGSGYGYGYGDGWAYGVQK